MLQWARQSGCRWDVSTCLGAASEGHLAVLQWARQNGCRWCDEITCAMAAAGGHLAVLEWLHQSGCRWDEDTCAGAAREGQLAVLQWAQHNGCSWDENTCTHAAAEGHLPVLEWARKNNCPWSGSTLLHAALSNHIDILKWARQQDPSCPWWSLDNNLHFYKNAADFTRAKHSTLLWLAQQGVPLPDEAQAIACSSANWLTHAYIALRALLPDEVVLCILTSAME